MNKKSFILLGKTQKIHRMSFFFPDKENLLFPSSQEIPFYKLKSFWKSTSRKRLFAPSKTN